MVLGSLRGMLMHQSRFRVEVKSFLGEGNRVRAYIRVLEKELEEGGEHLQSSHFG